MGILTIVSRAWLTRHSQEEASLGDKEVAVPVSADERRNAVLSTLGSRRVVGIVQQYQFDLQVAVAKDLCSGDANGPLSDRSGQRRH
jgi:hypothetical protein